MGRFHMGSFLWEFLFIFFCFLLSLLFSYGLCTSLSLSHLIREWAATTTRTSSSDFLSSQTMESLRQLYSAVLLKNLHLSPDWIVWYSDPPAERLRLQRYEVHLLWFHRLLCRLFPRFQLFRLRFLGAAKYNGGGIFQLIVKKFTKGPHLLHGL